MEKPKGLAWVYGAHGLIHANMITFPTVLVLVREDFGRSWFLLGAIATASNMAFGVLGLPAGLITDRLGARRVVLLSLAGSAAACVLAGLSPGLVTLAIALVMLGAFGGFYHPSALTLITTSLRRSGRSLGMHGVGGNVGMAVAPLALAGFASQAGWQAAFLGMGAVGVAFAFLAYSRLPHPNAAGSTPSDDEADPLEPAGVPIDPPTSLTNSPQAGRDVAPRARRRPAALGSLLLTYTIILILGFVYNGFIAFLPAYLGDRAPASLEGVLAGGALTTVVLLVGMGGQWWGGYMADLGRARVAYLTAAIVVGVSGAAMWGLTGWALVIAASAFSVLLFSGQPVGNSLLAELSSHRRRGLVFGLSFTLSFGVGSVATGAMGYIADHGGLEVVFLALGIATIPAIAAAALLVARGPREHAAAEAPRDDDRPYGAQTQTTTGSEARQ